MRAPLRSLGIVLLLPPLLLAFPGCGGNEVADAPATAPAPPADAGEPAGEAAEPAAPGNDRPEEEMPGDSGEMPGDSGETAGDSGEMPGDSGETAGAEADETNPEAYGQSEPPTPEYEYEGEGEYDQMPSEGAEVDYEPPESYELSGEEEEMARNASQSRPGSRTRGSAEAEPPAEPEPLPEDYRTQAAVALSQGLVKRGEQLYLAHLVAEPEKAAAEFDRAVWSDLLREPTWSVRWALGINLNRPNDYDGDLHPVRDDMAMPQTGDGPRGGRGGGGEPGYEEGYVSEGPGESGAPAAGSGGSRADAQDPAALDELDRYLGIFATITTDEYRARVSEGKYGAALNQLRLESPLPPSGTERAADRPRAGSEEAMIEESSEGEYRGEEPSEGEYSGEEAMPTGGGEPSYVGEDGFAGGGEPDAAGGAGAYMTPQLPQPDVPQLAPGLLYVGLGKTDELREKARDAGADVLIEFVVIANVNPRTNVVSNDTRARLHAVASGDSLGSSGKVNNVKMYQISERREGAGREEVQDQIDKLFAIADRKVATRPLPELNPEAVRGRVGSLIVSPPENPLAALAECRLYHQRGWLSDDDLATAYEMLLGEEGLVLIAGPTERKREILDQYAPRLY